MELPQCGTFCLTLCYLFRKTELTLLRDMANCKKFAGAWAEPEMVLPIFLQKLMLLL